MYGIPSRATSANREWILQNRQTDSVATKIGKFFHGIHPIRSPERTDTDRVLTKPEIRAYELLRRTNEIVFFSISTRTFETFQNVCRGFSRFVNGSRFRTISSFRDLHHAGRKNARGSARYGETQSKRIAVGLSYENVYIIWDTTVVRAGWFIMAVVVEYDNDIYVHYDVVRAISEETSTDSRPSVKCINRV